MSLIDTARLAYRTVVKNYPEQIVFSVTARCNFRCSMCYYTKDPSDNELTLDEYEKISRHIPNFHWMMISGGEPFLRDDLFEICQIFVRNNRVRKINLPTNAYFTELIIPTVERILNIRQDCFLNLGLSLHSIGKAHDEIAGVPGSFEHAMQTYRALQPLRKKYKNLGLAIPITYCSYNESAMRDLITFIFEKMEIDDICINLIRGEPRLPGAKSFSHERYAESCRFLHELIHRHKGYYFKLPFRGFYVSKDMVLRELILKTIRTGSFQIPCYAGRISAVINELGNVYPCELRNECLGNLRETGYNFRDIWKGETRRTVLEDISGHRCFCTHECFNTTNILFNPRLYGRLIRSWSTLHRKGWGFSFCTAKEKIR